MDKILESPSFLDELYNLFQFIDHITDLHRENRPGSDQGDLIYNKVSDQILASGGPPSDTNYQMKGYLDHEQIMIFQRIVATKNGIKIGKVEEDLLVVAFMRNLPKNSSDRTLVDWNCFKLTISKWVYQMSSDIVNAIEDSQGHMSRLDREALHSVINAFFIQSTTKDENRQRMSSLLEMAHEQVENLERDIENIDVSGSANQAHSDQDIQSLIQSSKQLLENVDNIMFGISHIHTSMIIVGW